MCQINHPNKVYHLKFYSLFLLLVLTKQNPITTQQIFLSHKPITILIKSPYHMLPYPYSESKPPSNPNYRTLDTQYDFSHQKNDLAYETIRSRQMMSSILDTIDEKAGDLRDLKKSLSKFDQEFMAMYRSQSNTNDPLQNKKPQQPSNQNAKHQNNFIQPSAHIQSFTTKSRIPQQSTLKLKLPKPNTLTDQFMKTLLGAQQQLIEQYDRTVHPGKYQLKIKDQVKRNARDLFMQENKGREGKRDFNVGELAMKRSPGDRSGAFYDQQYYTYLKTNMMYLSEMGAKNSNTQAISSSPYNNTHLINSFRDQIKNQCSLNHQLPDNSPFQPHFMYDPTLSQPQYLTINSNPSKQQPLLQASPQKIVKKLQQTGGIQNTIQKMQKSLKKNQLKHMRANEYIVKKPSLIDQHKQKRLSLNRSSAFLQKAYHNSSQVKGYKVNLTYNESTQNRINFTPSRGRDNVLKISKEHQPDYFRKRDHRKLQNPSFFDNQSRQNHQTKDKNWKEKSQSLRHKIQHSLDKS